MAMIAEGRSVGTSYVRISAAALSPPDHLLIVPHFFGGRLEMTNGLDVRVLDADFRASEAPDDDCDGQPPEPVLERVLLTLIDAQGVSVGQPAWCGWPSAPPRGHARPPCTCPTTTTTATPAPTHGCTGVTCSRHWST